MEKLIDTIAAGKKYNPKFVRGYSELEIGQIENLYDISLSGQFGRFIREMGRSDGGLVGDDPIIIYRPTWSVRAQLLHQFDFFYQMQDAGQFNFLANKPFAFSCEAETQHIFLQTDLEEQERIFRFDENEGTVHDLGCDFIEYMKYVVSSYWSEDCFVCTGELIKIGSKWTPRR